MRPVSLPLVFIIAIVAFFAGVAAESSRMKPPAGVQLAGEPAAGDSDGGIPGRNPEYKPPITSIAGIRMRSVQERLREVVPEQEVYFAQNVRYAPDVSLLPPTRKDPSVVVYVRWAGENGWVAEGTHPDAPGRSCVVYVGTKSYLPVLPSTALQGKPAGNSGQVVCDD